MKKSEASKIRERYDRLRDARVRALQRACRHSRLSDWIELHWAPGHSTGFELRICERCEKELHRRTSCNSCGKTIVDREIVEGSVENGCPIGGRYCKDCLPRVAAKTKREESEWKATMPEVRRKFDELKGKKKEVANALQRGEQLPRNRSPG